ncbi:hypothetical protein LSAT2_003947, partial [Lamellibrachia satsuma]
MSDAELDTCFIEQQDIVKSNNNLLHDHNANTSKVKLKACTVVLTDMFKFDRPVCVGKVLGGSSNAKVSVQRVSEVTPGREETSELTVKLDDTRDCTHSDDVSVDYPR